uniref:Uncharacterized protein n=1 Tax=Cannabis sativa TaxID=3483 RepID=A0A803R5H9_CANSA
MANNRWNWEVTGFEPRKTTTTMSSSSATSSPKSASTDFDDYKHGAPLVRRYSISAGSVLPLHSELSKHTIASKLQKLKDNINLAREDYLELRQEASELQEYSNAKLDRVKRYLGVLGDKSRKLGQQVLSMFICNFVWLR